jgi:hypothetical protein
MEEKNDNHYMKINNDRGAKTDNNDSGGPIATSTTQMSQSS